MRPAGDRAAEQLKITELSEVEEASLAALAELGLDDDSSDDDAAGEMPARQRRVEQVASQRGKSSVLLVDAAAARLVQRDEVDLEVLDPDFELELDEAAVDGEWIPITSAIRKHNKYNPLIHSW